MSLLRVRTVLEGWPGAPGLNTLYFMTDTGDPATGAPECQGRVHDFWESACEKFPVGFTARVDQLVDSLNETNGDLLASFSVQLPNVSEGQTAAADYLPAQTMAYIGFRTGVVVGQRKLRGGTYIGPMAEPALGTGGQMDADAQNVLAAAAIALMEPTGDGWQLCVWHRPTGPAAIDGAVHPVFDTTVSPVFAHLSSRRR